MSSSRVTPEEEASHVTESGTGERVQKRLREAFDLIDTNGNGSIDQAELGTLIRQQGENMSEEEVEKVLKEIDVDGDANGLTFDEFVEILRRTQIYSSLVARENGLTEHDLIDAFVTQAKTTSLTYKAKKPLYEQLRDRQEANHVGFSKSMNARMALAGMIDGNVAQIIVLALVLIDVICVIMELMLLDTMCPCANCWGASYGYGSSYSSTYSAYSAYSTSRRLAATGDACTSEISNEYSSKQILWHDWLHWISVSILGVFALQILALLILYGPFEFFQQPPYVADLIIVVGALIIENPPVSDHFDVGPVFVLLLSWRILRVVHGIFTSVEMQYHKQHEKMAGERDKMIDFVKTQRDTIKTKKQYFHVYQTELEDKGVTHTDQKIREKIEEELNKLDEGVDTMAEAKEEIEMLKKKVREEVARRLKAEHMYSEIYELVDSQHKTLVDQHDHLYHEAAHHTVNHKDSLKKKQITKATSGGKHKAEQ